MELGKEIGWIRPKNTDGGEYDDSLIKSQIEALDGELDKVQDDIRQDISNKADKSEINRIDEFLESINGNIPTKTSELTNDSGFLTAIPSEYVTETELNQKGYSTFNGDYNNLTNKPTIPSISGLVSESYVNEYVENAIKDIPKEEVDLSDYAKKTEIPTKTSQLTNDSNFLTSVPSEYITETELNAKGYLTEHQDISNKADKSEIPTKTSQLTNDSNFLTSVPSEYVTDSELNSKAYATETYVQNEIAKIDTTVLEDRASDLEDRASDLEDRVEILNNLSLGVHSDGGIYLFVNGEPVGLGIFMSNVEIKVSDGYITDDNTIILSDNIPSGTYSMKYENEDGSYTTIGNFEI